MTYIKHKKPGPRFILDFRVSVLIEDEDVESGYDAAQAGKSLMTKHPSEWAPLMVGPARLGPNMLAEVQVACINSQCVNYGEPFADFQVGVRQMKATFDAWSNFADERFNCPLCGELGEPIE